MSTLLRDISSMLDSNPSPSLVQLRMRWQFLGGVLLAVAFLALCIPLIKMTPSSWNDISRVAAIESLVERGTWAIDGSAWEKRTYDKILVNGHFYSDKPPLLSVFAAGLYAALHMAWGLSLAPDCSALCAYPWLTLILVTLPAALLIWLFYDYALKMRVALWLAMLGTIALAIGTMILPYSLVLNNHVPAAVCLFASYYILVTRFGQPEHRNRWLLLVGVLTGLATALDLLAGFTAAVLFFLLWLGQRNLIPFIVGALFPIAVTAWLDYQITPSVLPPYFFVAGYAYSNSPFAVAIAGIGPVQDYLRYAFQMLIGTRGLFQFNPILLLPILNIAHIVRDRTHPLRWQAICIGAGFILLVIYILLGTNDYGGPSYAERYFISGIPLLFSFMFFPFIPNSILLKRVIWILFAVCLSVSILSSFQGMQTPWRYSAPPLLAPIVDAKGSVVLPWIR